MLPSLLLTLSVLVSADIVEPSNELTKELTKEPHLWISDWTAPTQTLPQYPHPQMLMTQREYRLQQGEVVLHRCVEYRFGPADRKNEDKMASVRNSQLDGDCDFLHWSPQGWYWQAP